MSAQVPRHSFGQADLAEFAARMAELRRELEPPDAAGPFVAHTDGACLGNPRGPGGWAAVVQSSAELSVPALLWGHLSSTSNNRAEALGVLAALEWVPPESALAIFSDSELSVRILAGVYKARANPEIWDLIRGTIANKRLDVRAEWLRGHAGDPRNELADRLSRLGAHNGAADEFDAAGIDAAPRASALPADPPELHGLTPRGEWERDFVQSIRRQLQARRALSPKQLAVIERIRARGEG